MIRRPITFDAYADAGTPLAQCLDAELVFDPADPYAVQLDLGVDMDGRENVWEFARDLLAEGLDRVAGSGDVTVWTSNQTGKGRGWLTFIGLDSPDGRVVLATSTQSVRTFLNGTWRLVPPGCESVDVDGWIGDILADEDDRWRAI